MWHVNRFILHKLITFVLLKRKRKKNLYIILSFGLGAIFFLAVFKRPQHQFEVKSVDFIFKQQTISKYGDDKIALNILYDTRVSNHINR